MVDWDEILEDVDWKKFAGVIVLGLVVIVAAVFVGIDWHNSSTLQVLLENDLNQVHQFRDSWSGPNAKQMETLRQQQTDLGAQFQALGVTLPNSVNPDELEARVKAAANGTRVELLRVDTLPTKIDGYAYIQPFKIIFNAGDAGAAKGFLSALQQIQVPHTFNSEAMRLTGTITVVLEFYSFDESAWQEINDCNVKVTIPQIMAREVKGIYLFNSRVDNLKSKVDQESASLVDVKRKFTEQCELQAQVDRLKSEIAIVKTLQGAE
jgi:hypothetical protein